jgi:transposase
MRRIRECLRLGFELKLTQVECARSLSIGRGSVQEYWQRFKALGLSWAEANAMTDAELEGLFYGRPHRGKGCVIPDFAYVHCELSRVGVTLLLLWEEYREQHPNGYGYSRFCELYGRWRKRLKVYLRQVHRGGEKLYVDYSGKKPFWVDYKTGEIHEAEMFVMAWGASHYLYAEAQEDQKRRNWIMGHVRGFEYFACAPHATVPDNYKGAVSKAHRYDPDVNPAYTELATHYGFAVLPARAGKPKDKAKVEVGVLILQRWILARLRNRTFFSLEALNQAIRELLEEVNRRPMKKLGKSRLELFEQLDKPHAKALPSERYVYQEWRKATVSMDYHIELDRHYYSVPYTFYGQRVDVRLSESSLEVFHQGQRIALHSRSYKKHAYSTQPEHMPPSHQRHIQWTPHRLIQWAGKVGPLTGWTVERIMASKPHPEQGFRAALGILRLSKGYGPERLEKALGFAKAHGIRRVGAIQEILRNRLDQHRPPEEDLGCVVNAANVRGPDYYAQTNTFQEVSGYGPT